jgi:hypothetical protein
MDDSSSSPSNLVIGSNTQQLATRSKVFLHSGRHITTYQSNNDKSESQRSGVTLIAARMDQAGMAGMARCQGHAIWV